MDYNAGRLLITTYQHALLYELSQLDQAPWLIRLPSIGQREAISFPREGGNVAYLTRERFEGRGVADIFEVRWSLSEGFGSNAPVPEGADSSAQ